MKLISSMFPGKVEIDENHVFSFVIENKSLYLRVLKDIYYQTMGKSGEIILSEDSAVLSISGNIELITDFVTFEPNNKRLLGRVNKMLEEELNDGELFGETMDVITRIERLIYKATDSFPFDLSLDGITTSNLIKMVSPKIIDDSESEIEKVLNYMEIVREILGNRLFVMVGMRSFFSNEEMQGFIDTVLSHKYNVLLMESSENDILNGEKRLILDNDICEI